MILLVASNKDTASLNIKKQILAHYQFHKASQRFQENQIYETNIQERNVKLVTLNEESVYAQTLPDFFSGLELVLFISRHSSLSGTPTLSVHTPGNLGKAELGGIARTVSVSPANAMRNTLKAMTQLKQKLQLEYDVCYECTHHGPSLNVPTMFAELGSSPAQWNDLKAAEAVGRAAMEAIAKLAEPPIKTVLGIGGPHYNSKFTGLALDGSIAFGHMIPKYALSYIDTQILKQCIYRTLEKVEHAVLDWKGIKGENKQPLVSMLEETGTSFEKA